MDRLTEFIADQDARASVEYALIAALIVSAALFALWLAAVSNWALNRRLGRLGDRR